MSFVIFTLTLILAILGSYEDIKGYMLSNSTLYYGYCIIALKLIAEKDIAQTLTGAAAGFLILYITALLSKGGIGGGDIKIMAVFGAITGADCIMLAQLIGLFIAFIAAMIARVAWKKREIWLVPFLSSGVIIVYSIAMFMEKG